MFYLCQWGNLIIYFCGVVVCAALVMGFDKVCETDGSRCAFKVSGHSRPAAHCLD